MIPYLKQNQVGAGSQKTKAVEVMIIHTKMGNI